jgi:hypothetical protein
MVVGEDEEVMKIFCGDLRMSQSGKTARRPPSGGAPEPRRLIVLKDAEMGEVFNTNQYKFSSCRRQELIM